MFDFQNRLYVTRHGETDYNIQKKFQGWIDIPLNQHGIQQAHSAAALWKKQGIIFDVCITSDMQRTRETAKILSKYIDIHTSIENPLLREINMGKQEGLTREEYFKTYPYSNPIKHLNEKFIDGESYDEFSKRIEQFLLEIYEKYADKKILLVTHGGSMRVIRSILKNIALEEIIDTEIQNLEYHIY